MCGVTCILRSILIAANVVSFGIFSGSNVVSMVMASVAVIVCVGVTFILPFGVVRAAMFTAPVGVGLYVVILYRQATGPDGELDLDVGWVASLVVGDWLRRVPEGIAWTNLILGIGLLFGSAVYVFFNTEDDDDDDGGTQVIVVNNGDAPSEQPIDAHFRRRRANVPSLCMIPARVNMEPVPRHEPFAGERV